MVAQNFFSTVEKLLVLLKMEKASTANKYEAVPPSAPLDDGKQSPKSTKSTLSTWEAASFWSKWTFSVANPLLALGKQRPLTFDDMYTIRDADCSRELHAKLRNLYLYNSKPVWFLPRLMVALFQLHPFQWFLAAFYTLLEGWIRIAMPICLIFLLKSLRADDDAIHSSSIDNGYIWAGVITGLAILQTFVHHILFFITMRIGWNWRSATTALIYEGLFHINSAALQGTTSGKMVNLISNDVSRLEEFTLVSCLSMLIFLLFDSLSLSLSLSPLVCMFYLGLLT